MRKTAHWRLHPSPFEEQFIRTAAAQEGRSLSQMLHRLVYEAIMQRHSAEQQTKKVGELARLLKRRIRQSAQ